MYQPARSCLKASTLSLAFRGSCAAYSNIFACLARKEVGVVFEILYLTLHLRTSKSSQPSESLIEGLNAALRLNDAYQEQVMHTPFFYAGSEASKQLAHRNMLVPD